jgi:hypothetical protein
LIRRSLTFTGLELDRIYLGFVERRARANFGSELQVWIGREMTARPSRHAWPIRVPRDGEPCPCVLHRRRQRASPRVAEAAGELPSPANILPELV